MKTIITVLIIAVISGGAGYHIGVAKTKAPAYLEGRKFGFALGRMYYISGDSFDRTVIGAIFSDELKYTERQDLILHRKMIASGRAPTITEQLRAEEAQ